MIPVKIQAMSSFLIVFSSPSGGGKTSLARALCARDPSIHLSVSMTTRPARPGEHHGIDYYFAHEADFQEHIEKKSFAEYAHVYSHSYGSLRTHIEETLNHGHDVLFDIDWQGARQLRETYGTRVWSLFILPPNLKTLEHRLVNRDQDCPSTIQKRMAKAQEEMHHAWEYDHVVVNDDALKTLEKISALIAEERKLRSAHTP